MEDTTHQIPYWYSFTGAVVFFFGAVVLFSIWHRGEPGPAVSGQKRLRDNGWLFFCAGLAVWACLSVSYLIFQRTIPIVQVFGSTVNNVCFLFAAAYLDYGPELLKRRLQMTSRWIGFVTAIALAVLLCTLIVIPSISMSNTAVSMLPDLAVSVGTLTILGFGLVQSFRRRHFHVMKYVVVAVVTYAAGSQLYYVGCRIAVEWWPQHKALHWLFEYADAPYLLLLTSNIVLAGTFVALAVSWAMEGWAAKLWRITFDTRYDRDTRAYIPRVFVDIPEQQKARLLQLQDKSLGIMVEACIIRKAKDRNPNQNDLTVGGTICFSKREYQVTLPALTPIAAAMGLPGYPEIFDYVGNQQYRLKCEPEDIHFSDSFLRLYPDVSERLGLHEIPTPIFA